MIVIAHVEFEFLHVQQRFVFIIVFMICLSVLQKAYIIINLHNDHAKFTVSL